MLIPINLWLYTPFLELYGYYICILFITTYIIIQTNYAFPIWLPSLNFFILFSLLLTLVPAIPPIEYMFFLNNLGLFTVQPRAKKWPNPSLFLEFIYESNFVLAMAILNVVDYFFIFFRISAFPLSDTLQGWSIPMLQKKGKMTKTYIIYLLSMTYFFLQCTIV